MTTILGISGSLRKGSYNTLLLRTAAELMPDGATLRVASVRGIPLYDGDAEAATGAPEAVVALKEQILKADGLILATPEYNGSIPGVFKNTIDWLSRPASDIARVFGDMPVAVIGASPGRTGTLLAQTAWLPVLQVLGTRTWFGSRLLVGGASKVFDDTGRMTDDAMRARVAKFVAGFVAFTDSSPR